MTTDTNTPPVTFTTSTGKQIFMSYGLLNRLSLMIGQPDQISEIYLDTQLQMTIICTLFGTYDKEKQTFLLAEPDDLMVTVAEIPKLLTWVSEHILDFFVQGLTQAKTLEEKFKPRLGAFTSSQTGSGA